MNKTKPIVSVVCCTYNHELYIRQCLEGFVMQKTNFAFEVLVHDDASTDKTVDIIREYETKYPDIIKPIYQTENQYSKGVRINAIFNYPRAKGKYLALCEGDDYWIDPLKLQKQVDFLEANPDYSLCGSNGIIFWDNEDSYLEYFNNITYSQEIKPKKIIGNWPFPTASLVYRASVMEDYPSWTKEIYSGDMILILISMYKGKIYGMSDLTCMYRHSCTNKTSLSNMAALKRCFVTNQHLLMYKRFNEYTNGIYSDEIKVVVEELENNIAFDKLRKKSNLIAFIFHPILYVRKSVKRIKTIIKSKLNGSNIHQKL